LTIKAFIIVFPSEGRETLKKSKHKKMGAHFSLSDQDLEKEVLW
jgi:hypothetical protein